MAPSLEDWTLLDYLQIEPPDIIVHEAKSTKNTETRKVGYKVPDKIESWDEFDYDQLESMYEGKITKKILKSKYPLLNHANHIQYPFTEIPNEDSLNKFQVKWHQSMLSDALDAAQPDLYSYREDHIHMAAGGVAKNPYFKRGNRRFEPDWAGIRNPQVVNRDKVSGLRLKPNNILPGETKLSSKWTSKKVKPGRTSDLKRFHNWLRPMVQIFTYCVRSNARYGWIMSDTELVVVRVRPSTVEEAHPPNESLKPIKTKRRTQRAGSLQPDKGRPCDRARKHGVIQFRAIPLKVTESHRRAGKPALSANLGLFWLHILANQNHSIEDTYKPLRDQIWESRPEALETNDTDIRDMNDSDNEVIIDDTRDSEAETDDPVHPGWQLHHPRDIPTNLSLSQLEVDTGGGDLQPQGSARGSSISVPQTPSDSFQISATQTPNHSFHSTSSRKRYRGHEEEEEEEEEEAEQHGEDEGRGRNLRARRRRRPTKHSRGRSNGRIR